MSERRKRTTVWILGIAILVVASLGYYFLRGQDTEPQSSATLSVSPTHQIGQPIEVGGIQLTVLRSYESKGTDSERPRLNQVFTITRVSLTNGTDQPVTVRPGDFALLVDDKEMLPKPLSYVMNCLGETRLDPGDTTEGALSWETPTRYQSKMLVYDGPDSQSVTVNLLREAG